MGGRGTTSKDRYKSTGARSADTPLPGPDDASIKFDTSSAEARKFHRDSELEQLPLLDTNMIEALNQYSLGGDGDINGYLRNGNNTEKMFKSQSQLDTAISNLDSAMATTSLTDSIRVFRGGASDMSDGLKVGDTFIDKGFVSTSITRRNAEEFTPFRGKNSTGITGTVFSIHVPKGSKGIYMSDNLSQVASEKEFLMNRNPKFKVLSISEDHSAGIRNVSLSYMK